MTWTRKPPPGAAFASISQKTGRGRTTTGEAKVPDVETVECRAGLLHELVWRRGAIVCALCCETWAALDAIAREAS